MLIEDMVRIPSPTGGTDTIVDYLIAWAGENGFRSRRDEAGNFIAERGSGPEIMMVGHIDTVPGEIPVRIENGMLHGRGASDAKGPMACFLRPRRGSKAASSLSWVRLTKRPAPAEPRAYWANTSQAG